MDDLKDTILKYVIEEYAEEDDKVTYDTPLISSGLIDSFSLVDLALFIEDTYGVHIDDTELNAETFDTLDQLTGLIRQRQA